MKNPAMRPGACVEEIVKFTAQRATYRLHGEFMYLHTRSRFGSKKGRRRWSVYDPDPKTDCPARDALQRQFAYKALPVKRRAITVA